MRLDIEKFTFQDINKNIKNIKYNEKTLKFWSPIILAPFGVNNEYDKYLLKLELVKENEDHNHFRKIIETIETMIIQKLEIQNKEQFKNIIVCRPEKEDIVETKIKAFKGNIATIIEFKEKNNNYLKSVLELPKQSRVKVLLEIHGLWDYRNPDNPNEKNKIGLIIYANKVVVL
jgi:hypothetical protein